MPSRDLHGIARFTVAVDGRPADELTVPLTAPTVQAFKHTFWLGPTEIRIVVTFDPHLTLTPTEQTH